MYHLLVVDDEITSRNGLLRNIKGMNLGFAKTETADDGVHALELALRFRPDIVLTDVRMPRMDGIEMSYKLREMYPDVIIIFMSGYSDKEYLKSAIHLKAVNYVEKPVENEELEKSLRQALDMLDEMHRASSLQKDYQKMVSNLSLLGNELALRLTSAYRHKDKEFDYSLLGLDPSSCFTTILIRLFPENGCSIPSLFPVWERTAVQITRFLEQNHLQGIFAVKDDSYLVLHLAYSREQSAFITREYLTFFLSTLILLWDHNRYCIAVGSQADGIGQVFRSYGDAVMTMQQMFFTGYDQILFTAPSMKPAYTFRPELMEELHQHLLEENRMQAAGLLDDLCAELALYPATLSSNIRDYFYHLLTVISDTAQELLLNAFFDRTDAGELWNQLNRANTLQEIRQYSQTLLDSFFTMCGNVRSGSSNVLRIKNYIAANYRSSDLSVKQISDVMYMSLAYMCSIFKAETGITINQYITDIRLEDAKQLLRNKSYNISEVAAAVGFNDSQYFAKIFKKKTGLTPSMYKETQQ